MSQPTASPLRQLLDIKIEGGLEHRAHELFAEGKGYRLAARAISEESGVQISPEILRKWFPVDERPAQTPADQAAS